LKRVFLIAAAALLLASPAQAFSKQTGTRTMDDGVALAYDLYEPALAVPAGGWPGVIVLHGLGGSKDSMGLVAGYFADRGYAVLAYTARGHGTSGGNVELAGPREVADERAIFDWFRSLPEVSDAKIGGWGVSYGGGQLWNGLAAGIPYAAAEPVITWTDLYTALWPQSVARSGIVAGFAQSVSARSPLIASEQTDAIQSKNMDAIRALVAPRSALPKISSITTPVYMFQGRVDYAFDVTQATQAYTRLKGPKHLYIGQFGHPPSTFPGPDIQYVLGQGLAWFDHFLKGQPNGVDRTAPVTIAAATGPKRATYPGLPRTKTITVGFRGTSNARLGTRFQQPLETFGTSLLKVQVASVANYPRLVGVVYAGKKIVTHGAIVPKRGLNTIRLANYVVPLPKGTRLTVRFAPAGGTDLAYLGFGDTGSISLGTADLQLQVLTRRVTP
jgi:alpha-beta hydrolase superfamily lysophospholipase